MRKHPLNFLLVGVRGSGVRVLSDTINLHPDVHCFRSGLLDLDPRIRAEEMNRVFGRFIDLQLVSPEILLEHWIMQGLGIERDAIGIALYYDQMEQFGLWDWCSAMTNMGDFCVLQLCRNPLACLVSATQTPSRDGLPTPVHVQPGQAAQWCAKVLECEARLRRCCPDRAEIEHVEFVLDPIGTMRKICWFLERDYEYVVKPRTVRPPNWELSRRISNFSELVGSTGSWTEFLVDEGT